MVGGILADIYVASERNTPMVIFVGMTLFGTGLGPLVSDFIAQNTSWRWVYYLQTLTCGLLIAAVALFFNETRGSILLSRKAKALNK
jgi:MFS family permease